jgi:hypothetical protein
MPRLLIINCSSPYFFYIPMGSFGLCDYLGQREIAARIFNPALYQADAMHSRLQSVLADFQPTHVGFVLHWQETAHGLLTAVEAVKAWNPEVITLCGGFTASYFGADLLQTVEGLDYVVIGDPEEPVYQLMQGNPRSSIANLVWRDADGTLQRSENCWLMTSQLLDTLSFAGLHFLVDAARYLEKINTKLGFPVLLGRGCVFDCQYCGGSRSAFRLHSGRHRPVTRSVAAILADLHLLKEHTDLLYICYENDPAFVSTLFQAISEDQGLRGHFTLHYGAWHLLDQHFLEQYRAAFNCENILPLFEFSPEVFADSERAAIKGGHTYTINQLRENIIEIDRAFNGRVRMEVFFSRYHPSLSAEQLEDEVNNILLLKHQLFVLGAAPVHVCFDHLSTDVGSRYWQHHVDNPHVFTTLLHLKKQVDEGTLYPFPVDNLCLYIPDHLSPAFQLRMEAVLLVLERLELHCHELFHILFATLGAEWLQGLHELVAAALCSEGKADYFFAHPPLDALLDGLGQRLAANGCSLPFLADLIRFSRKKLACVGGARGDNEQPVSPCCLVLDKERMTIHEHDYLDLIAFLQRLQATRGGALSYQRTVCLFLDSGIVTMSHAAYRATLRFFEHPQTIACYLADLKGKKEIDSVQQQALLEQMVEEGVLRAVPCPG